MITVKLWGGLGNQLFQYAFGKYLSNTRREALTYFYSKSKMPDIGLLDPSLKLEGNNIPEYWRKEGIQSRLQRKLFQKFSFIKQEVYVEDELSFREQFPNKARAFDGYWQSYKYLEDIEPDIRSAIRFEGVDMGSLRALSEIKNTNSVSLHIRRGDYLQGRNKDIFCQCDFDYYKLAISTLIQRHSNLSFFIFSNDPLWIKQNYDFSELGDLKFTYVINDGMADGAVADLYLMSLCKHNVIANSTFSWWGAWLNTHSDKVVIAPKYWYKGSRNNFTRDLIPPTWLRLKNDSGMY